VSARDPRRARVLGVWTASWLAVFLLVGLLRLGDVAVQWPVLAVPLLWGLVALRPRRRPAWEVVRADTRDEPAAWDDGEWDDDPEEWPADRWDDDRWDDDRWRRGLPRPADRTDTVERPAVHRPGGDDPEDRRRRR
jgi:hypothetical protein